jgi:hypothetical protein
MTDSASPVGFANNLPNFRQSSGSFFSSSRVLIVRMKLATEKAMAGGGRV